MRYTPMRYTPMRCTAMRCTPVRYTPMRCTPVRWLFRGCTATGDIAGSCLQGCGLSGSAPSLLARPQSCIQLALDFNVESVRSTECRRQKFLPPRLNSIGGAKLNTNRNFRVPKDCRLKLGLSRLNFWGYGRYPN
jgi:hypothetical protein